MINAKPCFEEMINSVAREIYSRVELYEGEALLQTFTYDGALINFNVHRVGEENKFFGFGICQKLVVKLRDKEREINIEKGQRIEAVVGVGCDYMYPYPVFFVQEVQRDENTNELTITAYDAIYEASAHKASELDLPEDQSYTIKEVAEACAGLLGMPMRLANITEEEFNNLETAIINFEGTETIREVLNDIAEATGTIYFMCCQWCLTFKRLDIAGDAVFYIDKSKYFTLKNKTSFTLENLVSATELGDNIIASTGNEGETQYIRDNMFWTLREDIPALVEGLLDEVKGTTLTQFDCKWRGNFLLEIGDKIGLVAKDNSVFTAYILSDVTTYNGGLVARTQNNYESSVTEDFNNPSTLGETVKYTYAKVDKANKRIDIVVDDVSKIQLTTDGISASVQEIESNFSSSLGDINEEINTLTKAVNATMSAEDIQITISNALETGTSRVETTTGFTLDEQGLTVSKSGSEMTTTITEDGMQVFRDDTAVLTANNVGVDAANLHATTYLIVGSNSRLEDYDYGRTGCFWIGG